MGSSSHDSTGNSPAAAGLLAETGGLLRHRVYFRASASTVAVSVIRISPELERRKIVGPPPLTFPCKVPRTAPAVAVEPTAMLECTFPPLALASTSTAAPRGSATF